MSFFEGPEKKVELAVVDGHPSLREIPEAKWRGVVEAARANVLSVRRGTRCDAYLLSESSLFVFDNFVTMITCGRTLLVDAVAEMLRLVPDEAIAVLIYERKNEHFPHDQPTSFFDDARQLSTMIEGRAIRFGVEHEHAVRMFHTTRPHDPDEGDTTLEVLMHGIRPDRIREFRAVHLPDDGAVADQLGLAEILSGYEIDEHVFEPAGYSLNALDDGAYVTLHITPEPIGSYVSFETNLDVRDDADRIVDRLVRRFEPEAFDVVTFSPRTAKATIVPPLHVSGYNVRKHVEEPVCGYTVRFQHFYRPTEVVERAFVLKLA